MLEEGEQSGLVPLPEKVDARMSHLRRGWYWGRQEFGERLRDLLGKRLEGAKSRAYRRAPERVAHGLAQAEALVVGGLAAAGMEEEELELVPGSDPRKVALAKVVRERTTAPLGWVSERLVMGGAANAGHYVRNREWGQVLRRVPKGLQRYLKKLGDRS